MTVLGISLNSRMLALAIVIDTELHDFHTHLYKEPWSKRKEKQIVSRIAQCIARHSITHIALTIPYAHYENNETKALIEGIRTHCAKRLCSLTRYSPTALCAISQGARAKKKALMKHVAELYPELMFIYRKELTNKRRYYHKLFEAVAAGTLLARTIRS